MVDFDGGDLEEIYDRLNREYERSAARAEEVSERIDSVEDVAGDLFGEWEDELDSIERDTAKLIAEMQKAIAEADAFIQSMNG